MIEVVKWDPHEMANYDEVLEAGCAAELQGLLEASSQERLEFITDPRTVHERLYAKLTPLQCPEYAGTYRGTNGTTLANRRSGVTRDDDGTFQEFVAPEGVASNLDRIAVQAGKVFSLSPGTDVATILREIAILFYIFGLVHPFLDGNGHVQRLIFAACVIERNEIELSEAWTIHPRPYDVEIKHAFEAATTAKRIISLIGVLKAYVRVRDQ